MNADAVTTDSFETHVGELARRASSYMFDTGYGAQDILAVYIDMVAPWVQPAALFLYRTLNGGDDPIVGHHMHYYAVVPVHVIARLTNMDPVLVYLLMQQPPKGFVRALLVHEGHVGFVHIEPRPEILQ